MPSGSRSTTQRAVEARYGVTTEFPNLGLHSAAANGNIGLVKYALQHGQPVNSVIGGVLPIHAACSSGNETVVRMLVSYGADVNAPRLDTKLIPNGGEKSAAGRTIAVGTAGSTPLHFAAANGHHELVRYLLSLGSKPDAREKNGLTPEDVALQHGHEIVAAVIRSWEENVLIMIANGEISPGSSPGGGEMDVVGGGGGGVVDGSVVGVILRGKSLSASPSYSSLRSFAQPISTNHPHPHPSLSQNQSSTGVGASARRLLHKSSFDVPSAKKLARMASNSSLNGNGNGNGIPSPPFSSSRSSFQSSSSPAPVDPSTPTTPTPGSATTSIPTAAASSSAASTSKTGFMHRQTSVPIIASHFPTSPASTTFASSRPSFSASSSTLEKRRPSLPSVFEKASHPTQSLRQVLGFAHSGSASSTKGTNSDSSSVHSVGVDRVGVAGGVGLGLRKLGSKSSLASFFSYGGSKSSNNVSSVIGGNGRQIRDLFADAERPVGEMEEQPRRASEDLPRRSTLDGSLDGIDGIQTRSRASTLNETTMHGILPLPLTAPHFKTSFFGPDGITTQNIMNSSGNGSMTTSTSNRGPFYRPRKSSQLSVVAPVVDFAPDVTGGGEEAEQGSEEGNSVDHYSASGTSTIRRPPPLPIQQHSGGSGSTVAPRSSASGSASKSPRFLGRHSRTSSGQSSTSFSHHSSSNNPSPSSSHRRVEPIESRLEEDDLEEEEEDVERDEEEDEEEEIRMAGVGVFDEKEETGEGSDRFDAIVPPTFQTRSRAGSRSRKDSVSSSFSAASIGSRPTAPSSYNNPSVLNQITSTEKLPSLASPVRAEGAEVGDRLRVGAMNRASRSGSLGTDGGSVVGVQGGAFSSSPASSSSISATINSNYPPSTTSTAATSVLPSSPIALSNPLSPTSTTGHHHHHHHRAHRLSQAEAHSMVKKAERDILALSQTLSNGSGGAGGSSSTLSQHLAEYGGALSALRESTATETKRSKTHDGSEFAVYKVGKDGSHSRIVSGGERRVGGVGGGGALHHGDVGRLGGPAYQGRLDKRSFSTPVAGKRHKGGTSETGSALSTLSPVPTGVPTSTQVESAVTRIYDQRSVAMRSKTREAEKSLMQPWKTTTPPPDPDRLAPPSPEQLRKKSGESLNSKSKGRHRDIGGGGASESTTPDLSSPESSQVSSPRPTKSDVSQDSAAPELTITTIASSLHRSSRSPHSSETSSVSTRGGSKASPATPGHRHSRSSPSNIPSPTFSSIAPVTNASNSALDLNEKTPSDLIIPRWKAQEEALGLGLDGVALNDRSPRKTRFGRKWDALVSTVTGR